jgi:polyribonucleotide nucleotidyltransferase
MNLKRAKALRRKARTLMVSYVKARILTPEITQDRSDKELIAALPHRMHLMKRFTHTNGLLTQRWFYRLVKATPEITLDEIIRQVHPNEERSDDRPTTEEGTRAQAQAL